MSNEIDFTKWVDSKENRPFTINRLNNSQMMNLILEYYKGKSGKVLDLTYGAGTFWKHKPKDWQLTAIDEVPLKDFVIKSTWNNLHNINLRTDFDVIVFDPPYTSMKGGFDLISVKGYAKMNHNKEQHASYSIHMKYGNGLLPDYLALSLKNKYLKNNGILVFKRMEMTDVKQFYFYDYLIQDLGFQPSGFKLTNPHARPNHAYWMIFIPYRNIPPRKIR